MNSYCRARRSIIAEEVARGLRKCVSHFISSSAILHSGCDSLYEIPLWCNLRWLGQLPSVSYTGCTCLHVLVLSIKWKRDTQEPTLCVHVAVCGQQYASTCIASMECFLCYILCNHGVTRQLSGLLMVVAERALYKMNHVGCECEGPVTVHVHVHMCWNVHSGGARLGPAQASVLAGRGGGLL